MGFIEALPEASTLVHGDFHTGNVFLSGGESLFIDVDRMSVGDPIADISAVYLFYVGYTEFIPGMTEDFMGFSEETAKAFYNCFIRRYLDTDNEAEIEAVTQKARLLAYVRLIGQLKKKKPVSDKNRAVIEKLIEKIKEIVY